MWISGYVTDNETHKPVPYANIASYSQHQLFAADSTGHFFIQLPHHDSVKIVVLGYETRVFKLNSFTKNEEETFTFPLNRTSIMLKNIDINLKRGFIDASKEITSLGIMENLHLPADIIPYDKSKDFIPASYKPVFKHKPPVIAFLIHPVSYVSYFTGKKEKEKRKMVKLIYSQKADSLMNRNLIAEISGLKGDSLQNFIIYCNRNVKTSIKDNNVSVRRKVFDALERYLQQNNQ